MFDQFLFKKIDNAQLVVFRVFYGLLVSAECYGAIFTGWVRRTLVEPQFTFSFIGFEWLQPLPGHGMYIYFTLMGTLGLLIALGYKYRFSAFAFALLWTGVYLMQKTSYNNHYYLLMLLAYIMAFLPAHKDASLDAKLNPKIRSHSMFNWVRWVIILQLFIVYTYASIAKLYGDWLDFSIIEILMQSKKEFWLIGDFLQLKWVHKIVAFFGILFDLLIVPALLWKRTRKAAFVLAIFFHLFNSIVFQIGIFPYLSLAFIVFFFEPQTIRNLFLKTKNITLDSSVSIPKTKGLILSVLSIYFIIQLVLPIRHHFFQDDVLWTEEGHRMSWRMMLRTRTGNIQYRIVNTSNGVTTHIDLDDYLTSKQKSRVACYPDFAWQFAQHLKKEYAKNGEDIQVFVKNKVKVNNGIYAEFIDPETDLASVPWKHFAHNEWILPSPTE
ncbi:HTTM domain-containing protein [Flagellimonas zhangzhouensis]|uniref:Vitamin K-dependent gamma-carboxylase n=1 Tax=Flagellimonas zhangzhouensis TaxID=1073328 RepID=A0A1H2U1M3_9FLAO|nr:HTTM domain-containing protein [Allomuricauda zhangzhouensis]SDQ21351.1 Vitamin K-dependent gamma-carboxylase [Allomuricauda zhangzhouensis]SDW49868.1 Vitamin K-dependent gamma-carboxylase [Allomuricauda zhangzhouensis]